jgi:hypothetical protein
VSSPRKASPVAKATIPVTAKQIDPKSKPDPNATSEHELKSVAMAELEKRAKNLPGIRNWKWHGTKAT